MVYKKLSKAELFEAIKLWQGMVKKHGDKYYKFLDNYRELIYQQCKLHNMDDFYMKHIFYSRFS